MKLLYFTETYPYGIKKKWKQYELEELAKSFKEVVVVPFHYGGNRAHQEPPIKNIKYLSPLFDEFPDASFIGKVWSFLRSTKKAAYIKEFWNVGFSLHKFSQWLYSCYILEQTYKHPTIQEELVCSKEKKVAYFFWARLASKLVTILDNPNVYTAIKFHGYDLYDYRYKSNYIPFQSRQVEKANLLITISSEGKSYLNTKYKGINDKIKINRLGACSEGLSLPNVNKFVIATCCRLIPLKRMSLLAKALVNILDIRIDWIVIGDGECMSEIKELCNTMPSNVNVNFVGRVDSDEVLSKYVNNCIDLFVNVSLFEGIPVSIMEAMSAGIPVLATDVGGVSEMVNNSNGKLLDSKLTPEVLSTEIINFYRLSAEIKQEKRINAYDTYVRDYNAKSNAMDLATLLTEEIK